MIDFFRPNTNLNNNSSRYANDHLATYKSCINVKAHCNELLLRWWWCEFYSQNVRIDRLLVVWWRVSITIIWSRGLSFNALNRTTHMKLSVFCTWMSIGVFVPSEFHSWGRLSIWPGLSGCRSVCKMVYNKSCAPREYVLIAPRFPYLVQQNVY